MLRSTPHEAHPRWSRPLALVLPLATVAIGPLLLRAAGGADGR